MSRSTGIHGGLRLEAHKQRSTSHPVRLAGVPDELVLRLDQHAGLPATPIVRPGDPVALGQPIAQPSADVSAWLHAPVSGRVVAVGEDIVIANDRLDRRHDGCVGMADFESASPADLCEHIARGGIVGLGGAAFPTAAKLLHAGARRPLHLLLNGAECEPYISCDDMLMRERAADVVFGARVLLHATGANGCTIAVEDDMPQAHGALQAAATACRDERIRIAIVKSLYPAGGERQLIAAVMGIEVPFDGLPADAGVLCQNVGTAAAIAHWVRDGEPLVSRIVTITGEAVREPGNLEVRLGTPVASVIADCGGLLPGCARFIMGGSMMGITLPDDRVPIVKATNCIIAASAADLQPRGPEMPCIRCGECANACPAQLLPQELHRHVLTMDLPALARFGLADCIECGCCDYVCPSQIPLTQRFRETKPALAAQLEARTRATQARHRFEAREARLARLEAERQAKLAGKRKAARGET